MQRIGVLEMIMDEGVPRLVDCRGALLLLGYHEAVASDAHEELVARVLEVVHEYGRPILPNGKERRLVDEVSQIRAGSARSRAREALDVDRLVDRNLLHVDREDVLALLHVRHGYDDLAIEASRPEQGRIEDVRPVRGGEDNDSVLGVEAVHLDEHLVEGLLPLVVAAAVAGAAGASYRVELIYEDNAGRASPTLVE